jgi:hypothetical protein
MIRVQSTVQEKVNDCLVGRCATCGSGRLKILEIYGYIDKGDIEVIAGLPGGYRQFVMNKFDELCNRYDSQMFVETKMLVDDDGNVVSDDKSTNEDVPANMKGLAVGLPSEHTLTADEDKKSTNEDVAADTTNMEGLAVSTPKIARYASPMTPSPYSKRLSKRVKYQTAKITMPTYMSRNPMRCKSMRALKKVLGRLQWRRRERCKRSMKIRR